MNKQDFIDGWKKLKTFYPRLPDIEAEIERGKRDTLDIWMEMVYRFRREVWLEGITKYCKKERYAPTPAALMEYCFEASRELKEQEKERLASLAPEGATCKWCGGSGWIWIDDDQNYENDKKVFNCVCAASRDAELGRKILDKALADEGWYFDRAYHSFRRKHSWIGEEAVSEAAVRTAFEQGTVGELF